MGDRFAKFSSGVTGPYREAFIPTANSDNTFAQTSRAIYVGATGNVEVRMAGYNSANGATVLFEEVTAGTLLEIRVDRLTANTTANGVVILY